MDRLWQDGGTLDFEIEDLFDENNDGQDEKCNEKNGQRENDDGKENQVGEDDGQQSQREEENGKERRPSKRKCNEKSTVGGYT